MNKKRKKGRRGGIRPGFPYAPISEELFPSINHPEMGFRRKGSNDSNQEKRYKIDLSTVETVETPFQPEDIKAVPTNIRKGNGGEIKPVRIGLRNLPTSEDTVTSLIAKRMGYGPPHKDWITLIDTRAKNAGTSPLLGLELCSFQATESVICGSPHLPRMEETAKSYDFSQLDILDLYANSPEFRTIMNSGKYVYVNGRLVLNTSRVFLNRGGRYYINPQVATSIDRFSLSERIVYSRVNLHSHGRLHGGTPTHSENIYRYNHSTYVEPVCDDPVSAIYAKFDTYQKQRPPKESTFADALKKHMEESNIIEEGLSEITGIPVRTISRYRNEPTSRPNLDYTIAICIALHLFANVSEEMIKLAGYELRDTGNEYIYRFLLQVGASYTVKECNDFLRKIKLNPLTSL